ncbi:hypothetical protein [Aliamphritea ceti]|uniref:hypothetical protein n=1 Tax=Aliamphritea ceti TaxID=1524258 RepID=UPI0021C48FA6|nr:hypothetical protein [Aliamphritea ceti]
MAHVFHTTTTSLAHCHWQQTRLYFADPAENSMKESLKIHIYLRQKQQFLL